MAFNLTKAHKEQIERLARDGFVVEPVRYTTGDHLRVRVTRDRASGYVTIPGTPSDRKGWHQVLRGAKLATTTC